MTFKTTILKAEDMNATGIEVPAEVVERLGAGRRPRVQVTLKGYSYRSTVAVMGGKYLLPLAAVHRENAGVKGGEKVAVTVVLDTAPRVVEVPKDFSDALARHPRARAAFDKLSYTHRKEHVRAIEDASKPETRARRIEKAIEMLRATARPRERRSGMKALVLAGALLNVAWPASADEPLAPRSPVTKCSPSRQFCATADPRLDAVLVYPTHDRQRERWRLAGWERAFDVADDGDHLVVCYSGLNLLPLDYQPEWVLLRFYDRGTLLRQWTVRELIPDPTKLRRTASHYEWGGCAGFRADGSFEVRTVDRGALRFEVRSGRLTK